MTTDRYEKDLKKLFNNFPKRKYWGPVETFFLKQHHPSILVFNRKIITIIDWMIKINEANTSSEKFNEYIKYPIQEGYGCKKNYGDWKNMLDSFVTREIYGISIDYFNYWDASECAPKSNWNEKSIFDIGDDDIKAIWEWNWIAEHDNHWGSEDIKDFLWGESCLLDSSKTIIQRIISVTPESVINEVEMRKEKMKEVINRKQNFVCDDVWEKLNLKKIYETYQNENSNCETFKCRESKIHKISWF